MSFTCINSMKSAWPSGQGRRFFHFCGAGSSPVSAIDVFFIHFPFIFYFANVAKTPLRVSSSTIKNHNLVEMSFEYNLLNCHHIASA